MKATKLREGIYWVGGIDWDLRNFHGYLTQRFHVQCLSDYR